MFSKELWCSAVGSTGRSATATAHSISVAYGDSQSDWCRTRILLSESKLMTLCCVISWLWYSEVSHFDMFGLTRLVGLSSEMQPVCPCMLCKNIRYSLPKLSGGVFRRPYLTGLLRSMFQCCWTYSCLPAADTFCRGFVDGVHWLHQYWSITINYIFSKNIG